VCLWVNHEVFASLEISKTRVFDVTLLLIIIFEASLALVEVPKLFLSFLTEIKAGVLKVFLVD
jgi:hypothetical protein